jgi:hypothetical protein
MRGVAVPYAVLAAVLVLNAAVAQTNPGQPSPSSPSAQTMGQADTSAGKVDWGGRAPRGHRQPRVKDVPAGLDENAPIRSPEDEKIDRELRICRDC